MVIAAPKQSSTHKRLSIIDRGKCWARQLIHKKPQAVQQATVLPPQNEYLTNEPNPNRNFLFLPQMPAACMCCNCTQNISPISVKPLKITYLRCDDRNMAPISTSTPRQHQYTINLPPPTVNPPPPPSKRGSLNLKRSHRQDNMSTIDEDGYLVPTDIIRFNMRRNEFKSSSTPCNPNTYVDMDDFTNFERASRKREIKRTRSSSSKSPLKSKLIASTIIGTTSSNSLAISPPDIPPPPIPYSSSPSSTSSSTSISNSSISTVSSIAPFDDDSAAVNKLSIILNDLILNSTGNDKFDDIRRNLNEFNNCRKYSSTKQIDLNFNPNSSSISDSTNNSEDPLIYIDSGENTHENCTCLQNQQEKSCTMNDFRKHWNNFKKQNLMCIKPPNETALQQRNIEPSPWIFQNLSSSSSFVFSEPKSTENCRNHDYHAINEQRQLNQSRFEFTPADAAYDKSWENSLNSIMINGNMIINAPTKMPPPVPSQAPASLIRDDHKHLLSFDDSKDADLMLLNENYNSSLESKSLNRQSMKSSISEMDPFELEDINEFWYQPNISRHTVQEILISLDIGAFLIRHSNSCKDCFALSIRVPYFANITGVAHYLITRNENGYKLKGVDKEFKSLRSLVTHYSVMQEILPVTLNLNFSTTSLHQVPTSRSTTNTIKYRFDTLNMIK